jgi:hypothetical protein
MVNKSLLLDVEFTDYSSVDLTGYTPINTNYLIKLKKISSTPIELEKATGLHFLRVDNTTDRLFWPIHYKVVDEKKWTMIRLKHSI